MHENLIRVYNREPSVLSERKVSLKSLSLSSRLKDENNRFKERLVNTKSTYGQLRESPVPTMPRRTDSKREMIYLLEHQLGLKPSVIFPKLRKSNHHKHNS